MEEFDYIIRECPICHMIVHDQDSFFTEPMGGGQIIVRTHNQCPISSIPKP